MNILFVERLFQLLGESVPVLAGPLSVVLYWHAEGDQRIAAPSEYHFDDNGSDQH